MKTGFASIERAMAKRMLVMDEIRSAAEWQAKRGLTGSWYEPLPEGLSTRALEYINSKPHVFRGMVREVTK